MTRLFSLHFEARPKRLFGVPAIRSLALAAMAVALASCNSTSLTDGLGTASTQLASAPQPQADVGGQTAMASNQQPQPMPRTTTLVPQDQNRAASQVAALPRIPPVAFLPVTGAPQSAVTQLAAAMRQAARANAVPVVVSVNRGAKYQIKGYFSALNDGSGSVLVYVWDILDDKGVRINRISGQERGGPASGDPWSGISDDVIQRVAQATMSSLRGWISKTSAG